MRQLRQGGKQTNRQSTCEIGARGRRGLGSARKVDSIVALTALYKDVALCLEVRSAVDGGGWERVVWLWRVFRVWMGPCALGRSVANDVLGGCTGVMPLPHDCMAMTY